MTPLQRAVALAALLVAAVDAVSISTGGQAPRGVGVAPDPAASLAALPAPLAGGIADAAALRGTPMGRLRRVEEIEAWEGQALQAHQHVLEVIMAQQVALIAKEKQLIQKEHDQVLQLRHTSLFYSVLGGLADSLPALSQHTTIQALAALTGVRAFLPIAAVALGSKMLESFPVHAGKELAAWLGDWHTIAALCALAALEILLDKVRGVDEFVDSAMLIVKPAVAWFLAMAPMYAQAGVPLHGYQYVAAAALNAELVAIVKMSITAHVALVTDGTKSLARSLIEDGAVVFLLLQVMEFGLAGPCVIALSLMTFFSWLVAPYRAQAARPKR
mmetsp:Transcript_57786/g.152007  ORF Transcript_57786/g.152007 Transcript_57786/m.152007 type:complete len:330 (+) Transcript_57786:120-1109(+)